VDDDTYMLVFTVPGDDYDTMHRVRGALDAPTTCMQTGFMHNDAGALLLVCQVVYLGSEWAYADYYKTVEALAAATREIQYDARLRQYVVHCSHQPTRAPQEPA
jgi:hypothetical protein